MAVGLRGETRPANMSGSAARVTQFAIGEADVQLVDHGKDKAAHTVRAYGSTGAGRGNVF